MKPHFQFPMYAANFLGLMWYDHFPDGIKVANPNGAVAR